MKIAHPELKMNIDQAEGIVNVLVIENENFFYKTICDIYKQLNGADGKYVLSENNKPLPWGKNAELITQLVPFELNRKTLVTKLYSKLKSQAVNEHYVETCEFGRAMAEYVALLSQEVNADIVFDNSFDPIGVFKLMNVRLEEDCDGLAEKLLSYMLNVRELEGNKWFITVGLKNYLSRDELSELYRELALNKLNLLLIEGADKDRIEGEKKYIIDKDLCEIY